MVKMICELRMSGLSRSGLRNKLKKFSREGTHIFTNRKIDRIDKMDRIKKHEDPKNLVHPVNPVKNSS